MRNRHQQAGPEGSQRKEWSSSGRELHQRVSSEPHGGRVPAPRIGEARAVGSAPRSIDGRAR